MPLRDHLHPPLSEHRSWDGLHGAWPTMIVINLNKCLPRSYSAAPHVHLGAGFEVDIAASDDEQLQPSFETTHDSNGGTATAVWAPPEPTLALAVDISSQDEYEVRVYRANDQRLVAAVEIVSPSNKDRPESRRAFVAKCAALLQQGVSISIVDLVTAKQSNLYRELLAYLGESDPSFSNDSSSLYAAACRWREGRSASEFWTLETWAHPLALNGPLPTLPLWLSADLAVPLELEATYEETCQVLRIPA